MKERVYNKLVRDSIPDIIQEKGETPVFRTLDDGEFARCLEEKLREEVEEFLAEKSLSGCPCVHAVLLLPPPH